MEIKILVKVPPNQAKKLYEGVMFSIMGAKKEDEAYFDEAAGHIFWIVKGNPRRIRKVSSNILKFKTLLKGIVNNKIVKRTLLSQLENEKDKELFLNMINYETEVEIIKEATAQELMADKESWLSKLVGKFRKD